MKADGVAAAEVGRDGVAFEVVAGGGAGADSGDAHCEYIQQGRLVDTVAGDSVLRVGAGADGDVAAHDLPGSGWASQVFMVLLMVNFILQAGLFLGAVAEQHPHDALFFLRHSYNLLTIILFMLVLWRHYQQD